MESNKSSIGKSCSKCKEFKSFDDYYKHKLHSDGYSSNCKSCDNIRSKAKQEVYKGRNLNLLSDVFDICCVSCKNTKNMNNFSRSSIKRNGYSNVCKECDSVRKKNNRKDYKIKNSPNLLEEKKCCHCSQFKSTDEFYKDVSHSDGYNSRCKECYKNDTDLQIKKALYRRINQLVNHDYKSEHTLELLCCSFEFFKSWLQSQFISGIMSWDNYGAIWHIDHVIPCKNFDLTIAENQKIFFNWKNLQPLLASDNLSKSCKRDLLQETNQVILTNNFENMYLEGCC
jgi:hypothetical protein